MREEEEEEEEEVVAVAVHFFSYFLCFSYFLSLLLLSSAVSLSPYYYFFPLPPILCEVKREKRQNGEELSQSVEQIASKRICRVITHQVNWSVGWSSFGWSVGRFINSLRSFLSGANTRIGTTTSGRSDLRRRSPVMI